ncbi:MAG: exodeoxyribonuclease VII small subunit [Agathobacter sp.]|nr:exodeoxyribonuclease VII small subunit [Agathobacter sp.]
MKDNNKVNNDNKGMTLEEHFDVLDDIISSMEASDVSLDDSFELYKQGLNQIKAANEMLESIEKAMLILNEDGSLEEF